MWIDPHWLCWVYLDSLKKMFLIHLREPVHMSHLFINQSTVAVLHDFDSLVHKHYLFVNQTTLVTLYAFDSLKIMWSIYIFDHELDYTGLLEPSIVCFCMQPAQNCFVIQCLFIALHTMQSANSHSHLSSVAENTDTENVLTLYILKILILKMYNRSKIMQWNLQDRNMPFKRLTLGSNCLRS